MRLILLLVFLLPGCALLQPCPVDREASRMVDDWNAAAADGAIDEADFRMLDADAGHVTDALEQKKRAPFPPTGIPWVDLIGGLVGVSTAAAGIAHVTVNRSRNKAREARGEPTGKTKVA